MVAVIAAGVGTPADALRHHRHSLKRSDPVAVSPSKLPVAPSKPGLSEKKEGLGGLLFGTVGIGAGWWSWRRGAKRERALRDQLAASEHQLDAALASQASLHRNMEAHNERRRQYGAERRENDVTDTTNQLRFVSTAKFARKALLNHEERQVFRAALTAIKGTSYSLACQVSMGEFIGSDDNRAHQSINAKRSDLLVYEHSTFLPVLVIEHQGSGHYQDNAEARDEIKRVALERANIALLETTPTMEATAIVAAIEQLLGIGSNT